MLRGESGGWDAVDSVYRFRRPRTTEQVIHPRKFAAGERAGTIAVPVLGSCVARGGGGCSAPAWASSTSRCCSR